MKGPIPKELGNASSLISIGLFENELTGSIPKEITTLSNLKYLGLFDNKLEGDVPEPLMSQLDLLYLRLNDNNFDEIDHDSMCGSGYDWANFIYYDEEKDDYTVAYILVNTKSKNAYFKEVVSELEKDTQPLERLEDEGKVDSVVVTGAPAIIDVVINTINETMIGSIAYTILLSFIILTAVFWYTDGQPLLGIISMLPVLLVLVWILGTMVTIGYTLNVMTILIRALTGGLGGTYAIHISHRFIEEMEHHHSLEKAVNNTVKNLSLIHI